LADRYLLLSLYRLLAARGDVLRGAVKASGSGEV